MRTRVGSAVVVVVGLAWFATVAAAPAGAIAQSDAAIADAGLVVQTDLPGGYEATPDDDDSSNLDKEAKQFPACRALAALSSATKKTKAKPTKAQSPDFEAVDNQVTSETSVYATETDATTVATMLEDPILLRCLDPLMTVAMRQAMAETAKKLPKRQRKAAQRVAVDVAALPGDGGSGADDQATYRVTIQLGILQGTPMYADVVFVREGRALGFYTFVSVGAPSTVETTVLPAVVGRLAAAQA